MRYYKIDFIGANTNYKVFVPAIDFGAVDKIVNKILMADEDIIFSITKEISRSDWIVATEVGQ